MAETFAHLLYRFRIRRGLTKVELAQAVGAHRQSVQDWEAGRRVPRDRARLEDLADKLHLTSAEAEELIAAARQHPSLQPSATPPSPPDEAAAIAQPAAGSSRHQLRTPLPDFVGHTETISMLLDTLRRAGNDGRVAAISGVRGMGGIGKTELAYLVANLVIESFPDAQIVVALHGSSASPLTPSQAMQQVIYAFTPEVKLPDDPEALQRHYRSVLHQKRALILTDDARDAAQVCWLLPPKGCALLITSRARFTLTGMTAIDLEVLDEATAVTLLCGLCPRLGTADARHLARACGYLPLALRISASLLHNNPALSSATYLARLADERQRLALLRDPDDGQLDVAATLALSYAQLEQPDQLVFRQLGVIVTDFSTELARAVVAVPEGMDIVMILHGLLRRNLVMYDQARDRWRLHDLLRDLAQQYLEVAGKREITMWRLAQATLELAQTIQAQYLMGGDDILAALAQFDAERPHIDATWAWAMTQVGTPDSDQLLLGLALATTQISELRCDTERERLPRLKDALGAAQRLDQGHAEGRLLLGLGRAAFDLGTIREAIAAWERALAVFQSQGDRARAGRTLGNLGTAYIRLGQLQPAIQMFTQALDIFRTLGDQRGEAQALGNLGAVYAELGTAPLAIDLLEQALICASMVGDRRFEGMVRHALGDVTRALGAPERALSACDDGLAIARELGDRAQEGALLITQGCAATALGEHERANQIFEAALRIVQDFGNRWQEAECHWHYGLLLATQGDRDRALALLHRSVTYLAAIGHVQAARQTLLLARLAAGEALPSVTLRLPLGSDPERLGLAPADP